MQLFVKSETKHILSLDYDEITYEAVLSEALFLFAKFKFPILVYRSSEISYHLRFPDPIDESVAFNILRASKCSLDYKNFCRRVGMFPIRTSEKRRYKEGKLIEIKPEPKLINQIPSVFQL